MSNFKMFYSYAAFYDIFLLNYVDIFSCIYQLHLIGNCKWICLGRYVRKYNKGKIFWYGDILKLDHFKNTYFNKMFYFNAAFYDLFVKYVCVLDLNETDKYWFAPFCVAKRALTAAQYIRERSSYCCWGMSRAQALSERNLHLPPPHHKQVVSSASGAKLQRLPQRCCL